MNKEELRNSIKRVAALRSKAKGTSYSEELLNFKAALEEKLLNRDLKLNNQIPLKQTSFNPELYAMGVELGAGYIDRGIKTFDEFSKVMLTNIGSEIKPYIKSIYNGARDFPGLNNAGMTSYEEVCDINLDNIKLSYNSTNTSEHVKRKPVCIESGSERTNSGIQNNQTPFQPITGSDRPEYAGSTEEIRAINPDSESGLSSGGIDDVVPGDIASLFR